VLVSILLSLLTPLWVHLLFGKNIGIVNTWVAMFITWLFWGLIATCVVLYLIISIGFQANTVFSPWSILCMSLVYGIGYYVMSTREIKKPKIE
jgi:cytochrome c biogenesis factor